MTQIENCTTFTSEKWAKLIEDAPESTTADFLDREQATTRANALEAALGANTGWPAKYFDAINEKPTGLEWLSAFEQAQQTIEDNGILVFYGKRGTGKTRMAAELAVIKGGSKYRTAMRFFLEVRATFKKDAKQSELDVLEPMIATRLLILDEVQERGETAFEDRLLTHLIDARYSANRPTILITNLHKQNLAASLGDSIVSRATECGRSIEFNWESYRAKK